MALCKTIEKKNIDTNQIRAEASALAANLAGQAERAAEWVGPRVTKAAGEVARAAKEAQERLEPAYEEARTRVVEDYIPRAQRAAAAAYIIWRRSQPVEDPWAEEYWADSAEEEDDDTEAVAEA